MIGVTRRRTRAGKSRLVLVFHLIVWENRATISFDTQLKTALKILQTNSHIVFGFPVDSIIQQIMHFSDNLFTFVLSTSRVMFSTLYKIVRTFKALVKRIQRHSNCWIQLCCTVLNKVGTWIQHLCLHLSWINIILHRSTGYANAFSNVERYWMEMFHPFGGA